MFRWCFWCAVLMYLTSCQSHSGTTQTLKPNEDVLQKGVVSGPVTLAPNETFRFFLPSSYSDSLALPVVIFFDPHADGALPIQRYQTIAEDRQWILIGSDYASNEQSTENNLRHASALIQAVKARFHPSLIQLAGFSGGAKVALMAAATDPKVSAVVYAGAAEPIQPTHPLQLLGIAGQRDMNYPEVVLYHYSLPASFQHQLLVWGGKHEWPAPEVMVNAFRPLSSIEPDKLAHITNEEKSFLEKESVIHQQLAFAFQEKDLNWWKGTIARLQSDSLNAVSVRTLGFLSLAGYSLTNRAIRENQPALARQFLQIYQMADPQNPDVARLAAQLH
ncbi:MAG: hypothetical protein U0T84_03905 [Chitinophagales bacterium]